MPRQVYSKSDYSDQGFHSSYWAQSAQPITFENVTQKSVDLLIIGSGYTGLNAAITCAPKLSTLVVDANAIASGCSSRNGGDLCLGGSLLDTKEIEKAYGAGEEWNALTKSALDYVLQFHRAKKLPTQGENNHVYLTSKAAQKTHKNAPEYTDAVDGLPHAPFGLLTEPGYGINPRAYAAALIEEAKSKGAKFAPDCRVNRIQRSVTGWEVLTSQGRFVAHKVLFATNGYSQNGIHPAMNKIVFPIRSHILVTEPIAPEAFDHLGWSKLDPLYDDRKLLHYFRRLPENRVLFGMRGAFGHGQADRFAKTVKSHFDRMFPSLASIDVAQSWSGLVATTQAQIPYVGKRAENIYASLGYHGNGIALGSYCGQEIGKTILGQENALPEFLSTPPKPIRSAFATRIGLGALALTSGKPKRLEAKRS